MSGMAFHGAHHLHLAARLQLCHAEGHPFPDRQRPEFASPLSRGENESETASIVTVRSQVAASKADRCLRLSRSKCRCTMRDRIASEALTVLFWLMTMEPRNSGS